MCGCVKGMSYSLLRKEKYNIQNFSEVLEGLQNVFF